MRIAITGYPGSGKTTLSERMRDENLDLLIRHTDDLMHMEWSALSQFVVDNWFEEPGPWIVEGVRIPHCLRKWCKQNPYDSLPIDRLIILEDTFKDLNSGQRSMAKSLDKILDELFLTWPQFEEITSRFSLLHNPNGIELRKNPMLRY